MDEEAEEFWRYPLEPWHAKRMADFAEKYNLSPEAQTELRDIVEEIARDRYDEGIWVGGSDF